MITGKAADRTVAVEVVPGGALQELTLEAAALRLEPDELARRILLLTAAASARATASLWHAHDGVEALGLPEPGEATEETTPDSWRAQ
ncbi:YbaB/EbfC family DNA-binding protein [Amycolatopsis sp. Hca4]|uniref:YbaB/EbfC family DNA-binding protein n=1 Tax=Amycolatopsis sp. Hca4 TaxID=2742131 RepID=UPI0015912A6C|nr:YbaB/EbfC family DNA-binding protein [Amycolatopsis sp. Hca4]QKV73630.1 YbaB/EbfC family DNA-binding protein [Amycolatopsis sp. Hca4]